MLHSSSCGRWVCRELEFSSSPLGDGWICSSPCSHCAASTAAASLASHPPRLSKKCGVLWVPLQCGGFPRPGLEIIPAGCSVKCERLNRSLLTMGKVLWVTICSCTWHAPHPSCSWGTSVVNWRQSGHKWCLRDCSHHIPLGSREKPAFSKGHFSCPLWQMVRLLQINCCNYCILQFPDLLKLYPSPSQARRTLLVPPPLPWHSEETAMEEVVVTSLRNLICVAALQVVMALHQAQLHLVLQLLWVTLPGRGAHLGYQVRGRLNWMPPWGWLRVWGTRMVVCKILLQLYLAQRLCCTGYSPTDG